MNLSPWWSFTTGKAPGPASIPIECFWLMPHPVKKILLTHYNDCFLKLAKVVMIFKSTNKNSRHPSSYRPDSLANSIYKIYAAMLQQRLCKAIDPLLQPNQLIRLSPTKISCGASFPHQKTHRKFWTAHHFAIYLVPWLVTGFRQYWACACSNGSATIWSNTYFVQAIRALYHQAKF